MHRTSSLSTGISSPVRSSATATATRKLNDTADLRRIARVLTLARLHVEYMCVISLGAF